MVGAVVTQEKIDEAKEILAAHFGSDAVFNAEGWEYILKNHGGKLPLRIRAVPEGTVVDYKNGGSRAGLLSVVLAVACCGRRPLHHRSSPSLPCA